MASEHLPEDANVIIDFGSYVTIKNETDVDFGLNDSGIVDGYGNWPSGQPPNTIEARTDGEVHLKDPKFIGGSEGWVEYEVPIGRDKETFRLIFECPQSPGSKNRLEAANYNKNVLDITVEPYDKGGHPLYGNVRVSIKKTKESSHDTSRLALGRRAAPVVAAPRNTPFQAFYDIGFETPIVPIVDKPPVHETILIAAFIQSDIYFPKGTVYNNLNNKQWEYMRGVIWNDDPSCYLFKDYSDSNHHFSDGLKWYETYSGDDQGAIIKRSHYGDLQFLHGMATVDKEDPKVTQKKILKWLEILYKLACSNQGVSETDLLKDHFGDWFSDKTQPSGNDTLRTLILASTPNYNYTVIKNRALGMCLHMITDSYAVGHTQRRLMNPDAYRGRNNDGYMVFKSGQYGKWGPVMVFHSYDGQNKDRHSHYDGLEDKSLPVPKDLESFNFIIGARTAIDADTKLINYSAAGTRWEDGVEAFLKNEVFAIDCKAQPANSQVDQVGPDSGKCPGTSDAELDYEYRSGLERKLLSLENGADVPRRKGIWRDVLLAISTLAVAILLVLLSVVFFP